MHSKRGWFIGTLAAGLLLLAGCGQQGAGGTTVEGKLVDLCGQPLPYKTVFVPGHEPVLTAEDGSFTLTGVETPYDLVVSNAYLFPDVRERAAVLVYRGLTKSDPVVWANDASRPRRDTCAHASASGAITPARTTDEYRNGVALMAGPYVEGEEYAYDENYDVGLYFNPDLAGENNGVLFGIQWRRDTDTNDAIEFLAAKKLTVSLEDGTSLSQDLALDQEGIEVSSRDLSVDVQLPGVMDLEGVEHYVTVGGKTLPFETAYMDANEADGDGRFAMVGPVGEGLGSMLRAGALYGGGGGFYSAEGVGTLDLGSIAGAAIAWQQAAADSGEVTLGFPDPVVPIVPVSGATINLDTVFAWSGPEGALYDVVWVVDQYGDDFSIEVITTDSRLELPDLSGMGLRFDNARYVYWVVAALGGEAVPADVDALASEEAAGALVPLYLDEGTPPAGSGYLCFVDAGEFAFARDGIK